MGQRNIRSGLCSAGGVKGLKSELEEKTRVPSDRMKLMAKSKGKVVKQSLWNGCFGVLKQ